MFDPCLKNIPGRPPKGPGGSVYKPDVYSNDFGVFHFTEKPYLEMTTAFWLTLGQTYELGNYRISNDPSAPKNFFKDVSYNQNSRLFRSVISLDKLRITYALTFSIDFEKIDKVKVTITENAQPPRGKDY